MLRGYLERLAALAEEVGLPFRAPPRIPSTRMALEAAEWVRRERPGSFPAFHRAIFVSYWGEGRDIGDRAVILELAAGAGAPADELERALAERRMRAAVDESTQMALDAGVGGTPSWLIDRRLLVPGCQPRETFDRVIERLEQTRGS